MIKYLTALKTPNLKSADEKKEVVNLLIKRMGKYYPERSHHTVHASDVTKPDFCPRQYRLLDVTEKKRPDRYLAPALRATFDMGKDVADRICNDWLGDDAVGHWRCGVCGKEERFTNKPGPGCGQMLPCDWRYKEVNFVHATTGISGSIDLLLNLGGSKATVNELKIIKPEDFADIKAPLGEHRVRTQLYLRIIAESHSPYKALVDTEHAKIVYVSRGYGKKNENVGMIVPFKEYDIQRNDEAVEPYIILGNQVRQARLQNTIPQHKICPSVMCATAKACPVKAECWSGEY